MDKYEKHHRAFLDILEKNEDDLTTRLVYADWLDEFGFCEEAERQRLWPEAKKWMMDFAERCKEEIYARWGRWCDTEEELAEMVADGYDGPMSYEQLINLGHEAYVNGLNSEGEVTELEMHCGDKQEMMEFLQVERTAFWKSWSIITGKPLPDNFEDVTYLRCAC